MVGNDWGHDGSRFMVRDLSLIVITKEEVAKKRPWEEKQGMGMIYIYLRGESS